MLLADLAAAAERVRAVSGRGAKVAALADCLRAASPEEVPAVAAYLSGDLLQRQIGVGWAALRELPPPAAEASLTVAEVNDTLGRIGATGGAGSQAARRQLLEGLTGRATAAEQAFLRALLVGELRQGAQAGLMADAIAKAAGVPPARVRRALFLRGDLPAVAAVAMGEGEAGLAAIRLVVGRPLLPMLAGTAPDVASAFERTAPAAVEWKLDGVRIQVHRDGDEVGVFSRSLDDLTARVPEIVDAVRALPGRAFVLDGEAILLREDGRPEPFQVTASRAGRGPAAVKGRQLTTFLFDVLHLDGQDLVDHPGDERAAALAELAPEALRVPRLVPADAAQAEAFARDALARGHEGVLVKALASPYEAGRRGAGWLKVKPAHTLDLVILAAEWGHGRRQGLLSNLHLGARDPQSGEFVMLGKTFKGLTDAMLAWQTERLLALETRRTAATVYVRPELVVEIAFDGVQTSSRYPGGMALRFARVKGYREDKRPEDADTVDTVRAIHAGVA
jgi:DNA ligase-1